MNERMINALLALGLAWMSTAAAAQPAQWKQVRPSNTGIPGIQLHYATWAPDGKLWVAGRWPFWGEGGIGIYDVTQDLWTTLSNVDTPQPSQWVNEVAFAQDGSAWIATDDGLVHKAGEQWTLYTTANAPFLHNQIDDVAIAPNGHIWVNNSGVQTTNAAIFEFDGSVWRRFRVGSEIPFATPWVQLSEVLVTSDGHVWVANETLNGVAEFNGTSWTLRGEAVGRFGGGLVDLNGDLWLVAGVGGGNAFWRYQRGTEQWTQYGAGNTPFVNTTITRMGMDQQGRVYCGNWMGQVIRFDGTGWTEVASVGDAVYGICPAANGDLWVTTLGNGTQGEVVQVNGAGQSVRRLNTWNTGMPDYFVDRMSLDPEGDLWIATGEAGLSKFDGLRWRNWGNHNSGSEPYPFAGNEPMGGFYQDRTGAGWMGGNGIARWDRSSGQFTGFWNWQNNPGMGVTMFSSFAEDAAGNLFVAGDYGEVYKFNGSAWIQQPTSPGSYTSAYAGVRADHQGRVWAIGWLQGWRWDGAAWSRVDQTWDLFGLGGANCYTFGPDDTLWIGTNQGLLRVRPDGTTKVYTTANSPLPAKQVQGIDIRADGLLALSSHEFLSTTPFPTGVALIDGDADTAASWTIYKYGQDPIPHYQLGAVKFDGRGNLWISAISEGCAVLINPLRACYANCDGSSAIPLLNVNDFTCFLNRFAAGEAYANCDGSTAPPVLNVNDFTCFLNEYAAGCP